MSAWKPLLRQWLARWLKVPPEPQAPSGSPGTVRVFRASERYFRLKQAIWIGKQLLLLGFAIVFAIALHQAWSNGRIHLPEGRSFNDPTVRWVAGGLLAIHLLPLIVEVLSMPFTYALAWLDYDQRWYITTDRSLRIREGVWRVREMTLTFANIQQMTIRQNPIQRIFGISDLVVTTAGGGSGGSTGVGEPGQHGAEPVHTGVLRGVENPEQIRDWILQRMHSLKDSGLGDPDDMAHREPPKPGATPVLRSGDVHGSGLGPVVGNAAVLQAARGLAEEARALRRYLEDTNNGGQRPSSGNWAKM